LKKLVAPVLVVAGLSASLLVGATSVSWAQETPPTCGAAIQAVASFDRADLTAKTANRDAARKAAADAQKEADRWQARVLEQQAKADEAQRAFLAANAAADAAKTDTPEGIAERDKQRELAAAKLAERDTARGEVTQALIARDAARGVVTSQQRLAEAAGTRVDALQADLAKLEKTRDEVCAPIPGRDGEDGAPGTPTTTPPTAPPAADNDNGSNVDRGLEPGPIVPSGNGSVFTPVGGVETGGGPA
jgi:hypothetical protein